MVNSFQIEFKKSNSILNLGRYIEYRDIAIQIKSGNYDSALCSSELGASSMYDDLKNCFADNDCKDEFENKVHDVAPEILGKAPIEFNYKDIVSGIRSCE